MSREQAEVDWPTMVPQERIMQCINEYREGMIWKTHPLCAVCGQYSVHVTTINIDEKNKSPLNLEILRLRDEFIIQQVIGHCNDR